MKSILTATACIMFAATASAQTIRNPPAAIGPTAQLPVQPVQSQTVPLNGTTPPAFPGNVGGPTNQGGTLNGDQSIPSFPAPFNPDLAAPHPDQTTSGPLVNRPRAAQQPMQPPMGQPGEDGPFPMPTFQQARPPMQPPTQPQQQAAPSAPPVGNANTPAGIAARLGEAELDRLLRSPSGPPLPDADMGSHAGEAREEDELTRRLKVWQMRNKIGAEIVTAAKNLQTYRDTTYGRTPTQEGNQALLPSTAPIVQGPSQQGTAAPSRPRTPPLPVVTRVGGLGDNLTATILMPFDGAKTLKAGERLPNGMRVESIRRFDVVVQMPDGSRKTLPWGDSVPAFDEAEATPARQAQPTPGSSPAYPLAPVSAMPPPFR